MIPSHLLLRGLVAVPAVLGLVALGGTAAAENGLWVAASNAASPSSGPSASSTAPPDPVDEVFYRNCREVREAGEAPLRRWESGYRLGLDSDRDGLACERESDGREDNGDDGDDGENGDDGSDGRDGSDGEDGRDGRNGRDGVTRTVYIDVDPVDSGDGFGQIGSDDVPFGSVATG